MAEYFEKYKRRLKRNGVDIGETLTNNTTSFINSKFKASPTYRRLQVLSSQNPEIAEIDARVVEIERLGTLKEVLFKPNESLNIGTYVKFDDESWLIFDKYGTGSTDKVLVAQCNRTIKWKDATGAIQEWLCVASASDLGSKAKQSKNEIEWNKYDVRLPLGQLFVFVESNEATQQIRLNHRFIFGRNVFEVSGIDDVTGVDKNGFGVIQLTVKVTTGMNDDDFVNKIAVNKYATNEVEEVSTISIASVETNEEDTGGRLW